MSKSAVPTLTANTPVKLGASRERDGTSRAPPGGQDMHAAARPSVRRLEANGTRFQLLHPVKGGSMFALAVFSAACELRPPPTLLDYLLDGNAKTSSGKSSRSKECVRRPWLHHRMRTPT